MEQSGKGWIFLEAGRSTGKDGSPVEKHGRQTGSMIGLNRVESAGYVLEAGRLTGKIKDQWKSMEDKQEGLEDQQ